MNSAPTPLVIAVRVYPEHKSSEDEFNVPQRKFRLPDAMLVFDTETSTDHTQRLKFGSYRFIVGGRCLKESLFYTDDLPGEERRVLEQYVADPPERSVYESPCQLLLVSRSDFLKELYRDAYKARCLLVGFNLPSMRKCIAWSPITKLR